MASIKMSIRVRTTMTIGKKEKTFNIALNGITFLRIVANSYNSLLAASPCKLLSTLADRADIHLFLSVGPKSLIVCLSLSCNRTPQSQKRLRS